METTMTQPNYTSSITANISPLEATERISRVADWWTANITGPSGTSGDAFKISWGETWLALSVAELVPGKKIEWLVTDCNLGFIQDKKEWKDTRIVFDITSEGKETTVKMTHVGLVPSVECYGACETGWNFYILESLQGLLRENKGLPDMRGKRRTENQVAGAA
jgi:hypothetical protein